MVSQKHPFQDSVHQMAPPFSCYYTKAVVPRLLVSPTMYSQWLSTLDLFSLAVSSTEFSQKLKPDCSEQLKTALSIHFSGFFRRFSGFFDDIWSNLTSLNVKETYISIVCNLERSKGSPWLIYLIDSLRIGLDHHQPVRGQVRRRGRQVELSLWTRGRWPANLIGS